MRIDEIEESPVDHEFSMNEFEPALRGPTARLVHTSGANKVGVPWSLVKASGPYDTYGVLENQEVVGVIAVVDGPLGRHIDIVATRPDRRNHGVIRFLMDWIVDHEGPLYSSDNQTSAAKAMWQALIAMPGRRRFFAVDPAEPAIKTPLTKASIGVPWDKPETVILVETASSTPMQEQMEAIRIWVRPLYGAGNDSVGNP